MPAYKTKAANSPTSVSPALPGKPMSPKEFKAWVIAAEKGPTVGFKEFKSTWAERKEQLKKAMR